jgi:AraC family transcriptional regulator
VNAREEYLVRFAKVLAHVDANLDGDLTVERLSGVAAFSKFHFHRQFSALFGVGVYEYVQLMRLKRAAFELAFRDARSVLEIALDAGYESPESFARAFKKRVGQTPSDFRRQPDWLTWDETYRTVNDMRRTTMTTTTNAPQEVRLIDFQETRIGLLEHRGDVRTLGDSIRKFIAWRKDNHLSPRTSSTFNILHNDPEVTPADEFRLDICVATRGKVADNPYGVVESVIPGGRCAVLRRVGTDEGLGECIRYLYKEWLPSSGQEPRDFPPFAQRVQFFPDVPESEAITDIFLPLK